MANEVQTAPIENTEKPLFEIDLGREAEVFRPRSMVELANWFETERNWGWVVQLPSANISAPEIQRQRQNENNLIARITEAQDFLARGDQEGFVQAIRQVRDLIDQRYGQLDVFHSTSPRSRYLYSIPDSDAARFTLRYFQGHHLSNPGDVVELYGFVAGIVFDLNIAQTSSEAVIDTTLDRLSRINAEHEALRAQAGKLQDQYSESAANIATLFEQQRKEYSEAHASRNVQFEGLLQKTAKELDTLRKESANELSAISKTYDKKLALQSAVTYLDGKASTHRTAAIVTGIISLLVGGGFAGVAFWLGTTLLAGDKPQWNRVAVAVLTATLCFWLLRILVRMFLSNLHLSTDTRSRSTLMQTYLALLREGGGLKDDDRELILKMLFRPFSDGMVRDDAAPPGIWNVASRAVGGGK